MTVIQPNSISGINSITVQTGQALNVHDASGNLIRSLTSSSGVSTYQALHIGAGTTNNTQGITIGTGASIGQNTVNELHFFTSGTNHFGINNEGQLTCQGAGSQLNLTKTGSDATETTAVFYTSNSGTHNLVQIKTSTNNGGDPYIKFDGGGQDMVVGERYAGTTNNLLVLGPGTTPDTTSGIFVKGTGLVGVGTDSPAVALDVFRTKVANSDRNTDDAITVENAGTTNINLISANDNAGFLLFSDDVRAQGYVKYNHSTNALSFKTNGTEYLEVESTGNMKQTITSGGPGLTQTASGDHYILNKYDSNRTAAGETICMLQSTWNGKHVADVSFLTGTDTTNKDDGSITFRTSPSQGSIAKRMTIDQDGKVYFGNQSTLDPAATTSAGVSLSGEIGFFSANRTNDVPVCIGRAGNDGLLVRLHQAGTEEGNISVSGSTVSYNGGHLSRWSQLVGISTNVKSDRPTIYQGTVMSNLDAMCEWPGEDNQQLNKTKVSDSVGDKDVAGVFWAWDDDDDVYTNDFYVAMTGDMVIRVAGSTTVARGDLLESAGDGTAKPQSDDIVRSKTIAKIISTTSTATYADGSKAYPCVLMAC